MYSRMSRDIFPMLRGYGRIIVVYLETFSQATRIFASVADPGSGAFLTPDPGSGIGFFQIPDLGSQTHIFEGLVTNFWEKTSIILGKLGQIFYFSISKIK